MWFGGKQKQIPRHALAASRLLTARNDNGEGFEMPPIPALGPPVPQHKMSPRPARSPWLAERTLLARGDAMRPAGRFWPTEILAAAFSALVREMEACPDVYLAADWICE